MAHNDSKSRLTKALDAYARRRKRSQALLMIGAVLLVLGGYLAVGPYLGGWWVSEEHIAHVPYTQTKYGDPLVHAVQVDQVEQDPLSALAIPLGLMVAGTVSCLVGYRIRPKEDDTLEE